MKKCPQYYELRDIMSERASVYLDVDNNDEVSGPRASDSCVKQVEIEVEGGARFYIGGGTSGGTRDDSSGSASGGPSGGASGGSSSGRIVSAKSKTAPAVRIGA